MKGFLCNDPTTLLSTFSLAESSVNTLLGKFCGPNGVTLTSTGNHLLVKYNTKEMSESRGFMAAYYTKKNGKKKNQKNNSRLSSRILQYSFF